MSSNNGNYKKYRKGPGRIASVWVGHTQNT